MCHFRPYHQILLVTHFGWVPFFLSLERILAKVVEWWRREDNNLLLGMVTMSLVPLTTHLKDLFCKSGKILPQKTHFALKKHVSSSCFFNVSKIQNFPSKISLGHAFGLTSKLVASKWRNSPPQKKTFGWNLMTLLWKKKGGVGMVCQFLELGWNSRV